MAMAAAPAPVASSAAAAPPDVTPAPIQASTPVPPPAAKRADGRIIATPYAKKLAKELGVDLAALAGSGPNGRITAADVEASRNGKGGAIRASLHIYTYTHTHSSMHGYIVMARLWWSALLTRWLQLPAWEAQSQLF